MRVIISKKYKQILNIAFLLTVLLVIFLALIINFVDIEEVATALNINKYEVRSDLLLKAMDYLGVCSPEEAVNIWSNGLKMRSAAIQYSVMTSKLKLEYKADLEKTFSNWVTGMSSPWVDSFQIIKTEKKVDDSYVFSVKYITKTSTGPAG